MLQGSDRLVNLDLLDAQDLQQMVDRGAVLAAGSWYRAGLHLGLCSVERVARSADAT